ncbi:MAG: DNA translocase FtsK 4TM domain-containing protein, partial [Chitinophagaceae bacterium]
MANKLKKKAKINPENRTVKSVIKPFRAEKEEKIDLKALAHDERTWKIVGSVFLLISVFLFISFISYLFTWKEDQAIALQGFSALLENDFPAANLLGRLGAVISHFFIFKAFGLASFLICTFFFVVGVNLLFRRRVFSIWKNLKYVTVGLLVLSVLLSFLFTQVLQNGFPFGGGVGDMITRQLNSALGSVGTAAVLLLVVAGYFIWQFNPAFTLPQAKQPIIPEKKIEDESLSALKNEQEDQLVDSGSKINTLKSDGGIKINYPDEKPLFEFNMVEKEEPIEEKMEKLEDSQPTVENEIVSEIMHSHELEIPSRPSIIKKFESDQPINEKPVTKQPVESLELEIKAVPEKITEEAASAIENLPPYEPTLDLRDYKYPVLSLLETHGSEKIVQDTSELENHKNQIIATLRNYSIEIQKISATIGPTVTLYEIVPAAGVRISKIKNLEDDIALSLAALGIRIIAPIPGKGTIGIEVPNVKKTVVSMRTLLSSDKFQNNNFSLPIALGKKIDNENYIVDLASMPHLLMAGATGQGKSVGLNAILVSLLYKKHPSQIKFVLVDPKKVELSVYRHIENHFLAKLPGEEDAIITDTKKVVYTLNALCIEMDGRYDLLKDAGARNIKEYNEKFIKRKLNP